MSTEPAQRTGPPAPEPRWSYGRVTPLVLAFCWAAAVLEGYDAGVYGVVVPSLLQDPAWRLTPEAVGVIGGLGPMGMVIGSLAIGTLTDVLGRRKMLIGCLVAFSVFTGLCAFAPSPELFGLFRLLAGLGLGGVIPTAAALTGEYAPVRVRNLAYMLVFCGFPLGGLLVALIGIDVIPAWGWRSMFALALLPLVLVVPLALRYLPESITFLLAKGRDDQAERTARRFDLDVREFGAGDIGTRTSTSPEPGKLAALRTLFARRYWLATGCFWAATFLAVFGALGVSTWLPQLMRQAGYDLGSALTFLVVFNVGAVIGTVLIATVADKLGSKPVTIATFLAAAASIALIAVPMPTGALYVLVWIAGAGIISIPGLINAYVSKHYPANVVATALGWSLGIGHLGGIVAPVVLGLLVGAAPGSAWSFFAIAIPALVGAALTALVPKSRTGRPQAAVTVQSRP